MRRPTDFAERETRRYSGGDPAKRAAVALVATASALAVALIGVISFSHCRFSNLSHPGAASPLRSKLAFVESQVVLA